MADEIINRVAKSALISFDLEDYYPKGERKTLDISPWLTSGTILREKEFRDALENCDFRVYQDCFVAVHCSTDALLPAWAPLLITTYLQPYAKKIVWGSLSDLEMALFTPIIDQIDGAKFVNKPIIVKGCTNHFIPERVYVALVQKLQPFVKSLMFGEACSSVPLFKKQRS